MVRLVTRLSQILSLLKWQFVEEDGRRYFLLYLKPILNGSGNYYIEARTRNLERTDVIIDYQGEQFVVEIKIWRTDDRIILSRPCRVMQGESEKI